MKFSFSVPTLLAAIAVVSSSSFVVVVNAQQQCNGLKKKDCSNMSGCTFTQGNCVPLTSSPTGNPTSRPTDSPTIGPTIKPTSAPTQPPTQGPTETPSVNPTSPPTMNPTNTPTMKPSTSFVPTLNPTGLPTKGPTKTPSTNPTTGPTTGPTPTPSTSSIPTSTPSTTPTLGPTPFATSTAPSTAPSSSPTWCIEANNFVTTAPGFGLTNQNAFNMWLALDLDSSESYQAYVEAHEKWSSIILSDSNGGSYGNMAGIDLGEDECPTGMPDILDDLYVCGRDECIDGPGKVLGSAGPLYVWTSNSLTAVGKMKFDKDDVATYIPTKINTWKSVILHEMGHVLGLNGELFNSTLFRSDDRFTGANAVAVWQNDWGCTGYPPIETDGGVGYVIHLFNPLNFLSPRSEESFLAHSFFFLFVQRKLLWCRTAYAHWDEDCFVNELFTGWINSNMDNPLSRISIAALKDKGYSNVDMTKADLYSPPPACCNPPARRNLRRSLKNDVHPLEFEFFNDNIPGQGQGPPQGGRPPLSEKGKGIAKAYGFSLLQEAKLPPGVPREQNGLTYVGDLWVNVLYEENDHIYDVEVSADDN